MATLPHEREKAALEDIIDDCLKGRNKYVVVITPAYNQGKWLAQEAIEIIDESLNHLDSRQIKIYREALEFDNGAYIKFMCYSNPNILRGMKADRVVLMGEWGEFWQLLTVMISSGATIEGVG